MRSVDDERRPSWARTGIRTPEEPYPLRMFAEDTCEFALWGPAEERPPGVPDDQEYELLEDVIPISADLRDRLVQWASAHWTTPYTAGRGEALDRHGYDLSRELVVALPEVFSVEYGPGTAGPHLAELRQRARTEPLPRWSVR
jgi:hypothetical protein